MTDSKKDTLKERQKTLKAKQQKRALALRMNLRKRKQQQQARLHVGSISSELNSHLIISCS